MRGKNRKVVAQAVATMDDERDEHFAAKVVLGQKQPDDGSGLCQMGNPRKTVSNDRMFGTLVCSGGS
jgi:hypothetical protein